MCSIPDIRWRRTLRALRRCVLPALLALGGSAAAEDEGLHATIAGYSAGGMLGVVGEGLTTAVRREYPGSSIVYEPGNPAGGFMKLIRGQREFALQTPAEIRAAQQGLPPYRKPLANAQFSVVARVVRDMALQIVAREEFVREHGVRDLADLAALAARGVPVRISLNQRGNVLSQLMMGALFEQVGLTVEAIERAGGAAYYLPSRASADLMRNGRLDLFLTAGFVPSSLLTELAVGTDIALLPLPAAQRDLLRRRLDMEPYHLAAGSYAFLDSGLDTLSASFLLLGGPGTSFEQGYRMARALHRQFDYFRGLHPVFAAFQPGMLAESGGFALHPGARAYYREAGLLPE